MTDTTIPVGGTNKALRGFDTGNGIDEYVRDALSPYRDTSSTFGGTAGTVSVSSGHRLVSWLAHSTVGGTVKIDGATVPIPANVAMGDGWAGLVGPFDIVFTGTDSYLVVTNG